MNFANIIKYRFGHPDNNLVVLTTHKCGSKFFDSQKNLIEKRVFETTISFKKDIKDEVPPVLVWRNPIEHLQRAIWTEFGICDSFDEIYDKIMNDKCTHFSKWTYKTIWFSLKNYRYYMCHLKDIDNLIFAPNIIWAMIPTQNMTHMIKKNDIPKLKELEKLAIEDNIWLDKLMEHKLKTEPTYDLLHEKQSLI